MKDVDEKMMREIKGEVVLYQPDESIRMEVMFEEETVWLTQMQMAELFRTTKQNISSHVSNIFTEGELDRQSTVKDYLTVQLEGARTVERKIQYFNLDVIISVGYRVKSQVGTRFRQWANNVIKEHLLHGYSINRQLIALQERTDERFQGIQQQLDEQKEQVSFLVDMHGLICQNLFGLPNRTSFSSTTMWMNAHYFCWINARKESRVRYIPVSTNRMKLTSQNTINKPPRLRKFNCPIGFTTATLSLMMRYGF